MGLLTSVLLILLTVIIGILIGILYFAIKISSKIGLAATTTNPTPPVPNPHISELVFEQPGKEIIKVSVRQDFPDSMPVKLTQ